MLPLTNDVMKKMAHTVSVGQKTHKSKSRCDRRDQRQDRQRKKSNKREIMDMYFGKSLRRQLDDANPKEYKTHTSTMMVKTQNKRKKND